MPPTMETLTKRVAKLEREVRRLKVDPDAVMTPADVNAIKGLHRAEKAGALVSFDDLKRELDAR
jgi:hypothetical protein